MLRSAGAAATGGSRHARTSAPEATGPDLVVTGTRIKLDVRQIDMGGSERFGQTASFEPFAAPPSLAWPQPSSSVNATISESLRASHQYLQANTVAQGPGIGLQLASAAAGALPVVGTALGLYSLATGYDAITGEKVSRWGAAAGIALSFVPFGSIISKGKKFTKIGGEVLEQIDDLGAAAKRADDLIAAESNVWRLGPGPRGEALEQMLGHNLPGNFPTIDRFQTGIATSIKSIDLDAASYLSGNGLRSTLTRYVDKVAGFNGANWAKVRIQPNQITGRSLEVVMPHGGTAAQQATIADIVKYGSTQNVTVKVITVP